MWTFLLKTDTFVNLHRPYGVMDSVTSFYLFYLFICLVKLQMGFYPVAVILQ
jgi:hypothetical protein